LVLMKKTASALTIIFALLFSMVAGATFVNLATANPAPLLTLPTEPVTTLPTIVVYSPVQNQTYNSTKLWLNFTIVKPESWFAIGAVKITSIYFTVDDGERQNITMHDTDSLFDRLNFSTLLPSTGGAHTVKVSLDADSYYVVSYVDLSNAFSSVTLHADSEPVNFTVLVPNPVIVAPENTAYNESSVPLVFTVDTSATSWVGYSLDGKDNVTIAGNTTLTGLSNGEHNVTVYANDTSGNISASQTVNFTVALPPETKPFSTVAVASVSGASAVIAIAGLLVYFRKRKH
jgi:hypothetical protein